MDWPKYFSPIEWEAWCSIRNYGVPFYPQYPVLNYFIDFACPVLKIGLEMDGKDWHDKERDKKRDTDLGKQGWVIFRVKGVECHSEFKSLYQIDEEELEGHERGREIENWIFNTSDGVIAAINTVFFNGQDQKYLDLFVETLNRHRYLVPIFRSVTP